jgi:hypothetical protein
MSSRPTAFMTISVFCTEGVVSFNAPSEVRVVPEANRSVPAISVEYVSYGRYIDGMNSPMYSVLVHFTAVSVFRTEGASVGLDALSSKARVASEVNGSTSVIAAEQVSRQKVRRSNELTRVFKAHVFYGSPCLAK